MNALKKLKLDPEDSDSQVALLDVLLKQESFQLKKKLDVAKNDLAKLDKDLIDLLNSSLQLCKEPRRPENLPDTATMTDGDQEPSSSNTSWHSGRRRALEACREQIEAHYTCEFHLRQQEQKRKAELKTAKRADLEIQNAATLTFTQRTFDLAVKKAVQAAVKSKNAQGRGKAQAADQSKGAKKTGKGNGAPKTPKPAGKKKPAGGKGKKKGNQKR